MKRRDFLAALGLGTVSACAGSLAGCVSPAARGAPHVVVVGGGYGGATAARYLRKWSAGTIAVTLLERDAHLVSCPLSNLVIAGYRRMADITWGYDALRSGWGVRVIHDDAVDIDVARREVRLAAGGRLRFDRLVLSPGVDLLAAQVAGLAGNEERIPHAWKAGAQTQLLRRQLEAMPDGGVFVLHVPRAPFRCPPGPYERACVVARYLAQRKPRSKLLLFDANPEIQAKKALFEQAFNGPYRNIIEYRPDSTLLAVDAERLRAEMEFETVRADVLNVLPPMRAGRLVDRLGIALANGRWVEVDWRTMEARGVAGVHVLGDAVLSGTGMPKSGHLANQQGKLAAAAIIELLSDREPARETVMNNTCYSFVDERNAVHVSAVFRYRGGEEGFQPVSGAGGLSTAPSELEGRYAQAWADNIRADMLG